MPDNYIFEVETPIQGTAEPSHLNITVTPQCVQYRSLTTDGSVVYSSVGKCGESKVLRMVPEKLATYWDHWCDMSGFLVVFAVIFVVAWTVIHTVFRIYQTDDTPEMEERVSKLEEATKRKKAR